MKYILIRSIFECESSDQEGRGRSACEFVGYMAKRGKEVVGRCQTDPKNCYWQPRNSDSSLLRFHNEFAKDAAYFI